MEFAGNNKPLTKQEFIEYINTIPCDIFIIDDQVEIINLTTQKFEFKVLGQLYKEKQ